MKPCVVMISAGFYPQMGGAEVQALALSKTLQRLGMSAVVLTRHIPGEKNSEEIGGISVHRLSAPGRGLLNSFGFMLSCFRWLIGHRGEYKAIHVHLAGSPALAAAATGRLLGKRVVVKLGGGRGIGEIAASSRTFWGRWKLRLLKLLRPKLVCVTQDLVGELKDHGMRDEDAVVIPNGVDVHRFSPFSPTEKKERRRAMGWSEELSFLYVGRFAPEKQLDIFLGAFAEAIQKTHAKAALSLIGSGPEEGRLKERIKTLGIESHVRMHPPVTDIEKFYKIADVFVLPSISEGLSNALLEAMASGLAVLASRVGGTPDAVEDGSSGLLFDSNKPLEMRDQIARFLKDKDLAGMMGLKARERMLANFDLGSVARKYIELYGLG